MPVSYTHLDVYKRQTLVNSIPANLKYGITAGIGLFISIIGLKGAGVVVGSESTLVDMGKMSSPEAVLALVGLLLIGTMWHLSLIHI